MEWAYTWLIVLSFFTIGTFIGVLIVESRIDKLENKVKQMTPDRRLD